MIYFVILAMYLEIPEIQQQTIKLCYQQLCKELPYIKSKESIFNYNFRLPVLTLRNEV